MHGLVAHGVGFDQIAGLDEIVHWGFGHLKTPCVDQRRQQDAADWTEINGTLVAAGRVRDNGANPGFDINPRSSRNFNANVAAALGKETVRAHTRWLGMPARAPMGHGIADHLPDFTREIGAEVDKLWNAKEAA